MRWFAQIAETTDVFNNIAVQWGSLGVLALFTGIVVYVLWKDNKRLRSENRQSLLDRLADAREFSKLEQIPKDKLIEFIGSLYDLSNRSKRSK